MRELLVGAAAILIGIVAGRELWPGECAPAVPMANHQQKDAGRVPRKFDAAPSRPRGLCGPAGCDGQPYPNTAWPPGYPATP